jgi:alpha-galactosidase
MIKRFITFVAIIVSSVSHLQAKEPLKVFILVGQSNMQGHAEVSTFDHVGMDPRTAPILKEMRDADGNPRVCEQVWISSIGNGGSEQEYHGQLTAGYGAKGRGTKIGPEFTFGIYMQKHLNEPILIIKTAWGGKSLHTDFRPPSSGPYEFNDSQLETLKKQGKDVEQVKADRAKASGHYYRLMLEHVNKVLADIKRVYPKYDADAGYELAGFVWFQGWNDMVGRDVYPNRDKPGGYDLYTKLMSQFIRDIRKDLSAPNLPFVIGVMGVGGPVAKYRPDQKRYSSIHQNFRDAMAASASLPEFKGNVKAVLTQNYWDAELDELKARGGKIRAKSQELSKDESLTRKQREEALAKFRAELYTARELEVLKGSSNAAYHYNGSAKIMAQIGKGFADAIAETQK